MQLLQLRSESLKKIQPWTIFELLTSVKAVHCSNNLANKPTGNWLFYCLVLKGLEINECIKTIRELRDQDLIVKNVHSSHKINFTSSLQVRKDSVRYFFIKLHQVLIVIT